MHYPPIQRFLTSFDSYFYELLLLEAGIDHPISTEKKEALLESISEKGAEFVNWITLPEGERGKAFKLLLPGIIESTSRGWEEAIKAESRLNRLKGLLEVSMDKGPEAVQNLCLEIFDKIPASEEILAREKESLSDVPTLHAILNSEDKDLLELGTISVTISFLKDLLNLFEEYKSTQQNILKEKNRRDQLHEFIGEVREIEQNKKEL